MLTETFVIATEDPEKVSNRSLTGVHFHALQPATKLTSTFKKSSAKPHCLATSRTHVFAAQAGKGVIHVYSRERNNQEAVVPFPDKIYSITLAGAQHATGALIAGTESGGLILWELSSGRQVSTSKYHLKAVTCLAVDVKSHLILSGSADSSVHVWSLSSLLSFSSSNLLGQDDAASPIRTLSDHGGFPVVDIAFGHSASKRNIAVSLGGDKVCIIWDPRQGTRLASYLLPASPLCIALDPLDRAAYVGLDDGSIQLLNFFSSKTLVNPLYAHHSGSARNVEPSDRWPLNEEERPALQCMAVSYDGGTLLSGHTNGKVYSWSVGGSIKKQIADFAAPITNLQMLTPTGFLNATEPPVKVHQVTKPRYEDFSRSLDRGMPSSWSANLELMGTVASTATWLETSDHGNVTRPVHQAMNGPGWPRDFLESMVVQFQAEQVKMPVQDSEAVADLQRQNAALLKDLESSKQAANEFARKEKRRRQADEIKASKKRKRRERERLTDEVSRKKIMGEPVEGLEVEMQEADGEDESVSSDTDELTDVD